MLGGPKERTALNGVQAVRGPGKGKAVGVEDKKQKKDVYVGC